MTIIEGVILLIVFTGLVFVMLKALKNDRDC